MRFKIKYWSVLYHTTAELKLMFGKEKDQRLAVRIQAIYLALMGKTAVETAELLGYSRRVVQAWGNSYNRQCLDGLTDEKGQHYLANRIYDGYNDLRKAANLAWHRVCLDPRKIKSICRAKNLDSAFI